MSLLHTADLHLTEKNEERWAALDELVNLALRYKVSALVISGDLFDHHTEAERLRSRLRSSLGGKNFKTVILPGNHDHKVYRSGLYFGDDVSIIANWEEPVFLNDLVIWGLPYEQISGEKLVRRLHEIASRMKPDQKNYLLFHGELLDAYFSDQDMGDEGNLRYMPVRLSYFEAMPVKSVLAGHFHSRYASWRLPGGGFFIYPGSPVAVTRREAGIRKANLVNSGEDPVEISLDTSHYEELIIDLDPFSQKDPLEILDNKLENTHPRAKIFLTVQGLFNSSAVGLTEKKLVEEIRKRVEGRFAAEPSIMFSDVQHILENDLFRRFKYKLDETDCSYEQREKVLEMLIGAFRMVQL